MNPKFVEARELVIKAREAMRRGDKPSAWKLGEQAALLVPDMEDAWLILAASEPDPEEALAYAQKALELNPSSTRAPKAVEWAKGRIKPAPAPKAAAVGFVSIAPPIRQTAPQPVVKSNPRSRTWMYAAVFLGILLCAVGVFAAYSAVTHPAFASFGKSVPTQENLWAPMKIAKPEIEPVQGNAFEPQVAASTATPEPKDTVPTETPAPEATDVPTEAATVTPEATATPGEMVMEIVADTPTSAYVAPKPSGELPAVAHTGNGTRWIDVDLTNQAVYAYEGDVMVNSFIVSTGTWLTPTVTGQYHIYVKYRSAKMSGPGYYLPNVPYIMYFYKGYGLHGTYWHNNFGTPMSHGCVNLRTDEAAWLYDWASVGTLVNVHY
jgi:lipoprotein-anchoring transpeptidase ErfK/SrfK